MIEVETAPVLSCPGCRSPYRTLAETAVPDFKYGVTGVWSFVNCQDCGLIYLAERPLDLGSAYPEEYRQHRPPGRADAKGGAVRRTLRGAVLATYGYPRPRTTALGRLATLLPPLRLRATYGFLLFPQSARHGRLLDVGCGQGRFLSVMGRLGWEVHGIEPDEVSATFARGASRATVHAELGPDLYPEDYFDLVTMNHALEHVADPVSLLRTCRRLCRKDAQVGIVVPNWSSLTHLLFNRCWYALEPPRHLVMYEPSTLADLVTRAGFTIVSIKTTSVRDGRTAWARSWQYRTGRNSRALVPTVGTLLSFLAGGIRPLGRGEEIVLWARG